MEPTTHSAITALFQSETFLWFLGIAMPLLFTYGIWFIYRLNKNNDRSIDPASSVPVQRDQAGEAQGPIHNLNQIDRTGAEALPAPTETNLHRPPEPDPAPAPPKSSLSLALANTRQSFFGRLKSMFAGKAMLESGELEDLEEILYTSDLGPKTVQRLMAAVETRLKAAGSAGFEAVREALKSEMLGILLSTGSSGVSTDASTPAQDSVGDSANDTGTDSGSDSGSDSGASDGLENLAVWHGHPALLMVVGVNGAGKTTTIGKLARRFALSGKKVLVAAGDTFRAAAGDQLKIWTERAQVDIFFPDGVSDPSAVAYAACQKAQAEGFDIVIVDTAGRLHTQKNLMEELKKMKRVVQKLIPEAPHEVLLVLDSNSGQNALIQAREFHQALGVTGVVLTKLDGTAKGGVAIGLACELKLPIKLIGVGEGVDDLRRFSPQEFVDSII